MNMFLSVLERIPKTRSELVNELNLPDVTLSPYVSEDPSNNSSLDLEATEHSESSLDLSKAMADAEIDYGSYTRKTFKSRVGTDPWAQMKAALDAFPQDYLDSMKGYYTPSERLEKSHKREHLYIEELKLKMLKFFEEECRVFEPDDPGLSVLTRALEELDIKESDSESSLSKS